jgi:hypothetical protein
MTHKQHFLGFFLLFLVVSACSAGKINGELAADAPPDRVPPITGEFAVNGIDPIGTEYGGKLIITPGTQAGTYHLQWILTGNVQQGVGILTGNTLQVKWQTVADQKAQSGGSATYVITERGELHGTRTIDGFTGQGNEQAFPDPR